MSQIVIVLLGALFGLVLSRSGAADYNQIQQMFLLQSFQLYGIIGSAIAVALPGLYLLKRYGRTIGGEPIAIKAKPQHRGNWIGGLLFGVGWAITGMCPGPILVNVGEGKLYAIAAFAGALIGAYLVGAAYPWLVRRLGLPPIGEGPGAG